MDIFYLKKNHNLLLFFVERLKKIQQAKPTGAKEPPYLSFAEYLSGNVGKKSPYKKRAKISTKPKR